jgi:hemerythrin-like domain-containing protein
MEARKPIKRSKELMPLSREHHEGLLLCWKIRNSISKKIDTAEIVKDVLDVFENDLEQHFVNEEQNLFTLLPADNALRQKAERQHEELRAMIRQMAGNEGMLQDKLNEFANLLDEHIRFEERELFIIIETECDPVLLSKAGEQVAERNNCKNNKGNNLQKTK